MIKSSVGETAGRVVRGKAGPVLWGFRCSRVSYAYSQAPRSSLFFAVALSFRAAAAEVVHTTEKGDEEETQGFPANGGVAAGSGRRVACAFSGCTCVEALSSLPAGGRKNVPAKRKNCAFVCVCVCVCVCLCDNRSPLSAYWRVKSGGGIKSKP